MNIEELKVISSIIGMIGGFLGFYAFIDNYLLPFSPKFKLSNTLFIKYSRAERFKDYNGKPIEELFLKLEIINKRNKIGKINDLAVRLYDPSSTEPKTCLLYAKNELKDLPDDIELLQKEEKTSFSSISILNKSSKKSTVIFSAEHGIGTLINPFNSIKMDLIYNYKNNHWKVIDSYSLFNFTCETDFEREDGFKKYNLLDYAIKRRSIENYLKKPEVSLYKGLSGKYLPYYLKKPFYFTKSLLINLLKYPALLIKLFKLAAYQLYQNFIVLPFIIKKSKHLPSITFSNPRAHLKEETQSAFIKISQHIKNIVEKVNLVANENAQIKIHSSSDTPEFSLTRGRLTLKFYISGDGHISAIDDNGYPQTICFSMKLTEYPLGIRLWTINDKVMSKKSACIHIMDSFLLLAH